MDDHRPLWLSELRKEVPAGAQYNLEQAIGSNSTIFKSRAATFKSGYDKYNRTCDVQKDIKVYNDQADTDARGVASYDVAVSACGNGAKWHQALMALLQGDDLINDHSLGGEQGIMYNHP